MHLFGYIDPGSGSLFIQALIGAIIGGAYVFRSFIANLYRKLTSSFKKDSQPASSESAKD